MKKLHLLCNAHLDPVWLWCRNEGLAEALSTFRVAARFCEEYDGFVFNHNEALLYEWVEEYEPALFERIQKLVAQGKWHIMGGWYLQPDCVMTSGESLLSQIELGRRYFEEKFHVTPTAAMNVDPFGHSRGLVQILAATGYSHYLFKRPKQMKGDFIWEGYDGSRVIAHGIDGGYNSGKGEALSKIKNCIANTDKDIQLCLWGIGNHGGGPSKIDLDAIEAFRKESDVEIIHSTPEAYFAEVDGSHLPIRRESLIPSMVGCYTSMVRIKQANRRVENLIATTEKIMTYAELTTGLPFAADELKKAKKALAFCQFHDILPGSAIKPAEDDALRTLAYAEELTQELYTKAFFAMCAGQPTAEPDTIPILIFNPHPYEINGEFEIGFMLANQNWNGDEETFATVYDQNGSPLPTQNEKPDATFNLDWIQKISFCGTLAPAGITRFNCHLKVVKKGNAGFPQKGDTIRVCNERMEFIVDRRTGLIKKYTIDGKRLVENSGLLEVYKDNEDPWGMTVSSFTDIEGPFRLMSKEAANAFVGYPDETTPAVRVVEDGAVRTRIQSFWEYGDSRAVVEYTVPKRGIYVDVNVIIHSSEPNKMIKFRLDTAFSGTPYGQTAFGSEELFSNNDEAVYHKWCAIKGTDSGLTVYNNGIYGGSFTDHSIRLSLLRTPVYSAFPILDRQIAPHDRLLEHIDIGERRFSFRLSDMQDMERRAQVFNEAPYALSFFPSGSGEQPGSVMTIDNPQVILSSLRKEDGRTRLTLYNASDKEEIATIRLLSTGQEWQERFGKYQLKFVDLP